MSIQGFNYFEGTDFKLGTPVYLEVSYRNDVNLQIGLSYRSANDIVQYAPPILYLKASPDEWKTVYVNLTNEAGLLASYPSVDASKNLSGTTSESNDVYGSTKKVETVFIDKEEILLTKNQILYILENFKSKTLAQFDNQQDLLKQYVKSEKLKFKDKNSLIV